jgi:hypothetical protein
MITTIVNAVEGDQIREGLFIPLDLFAGHRDLEIEVSDAGVVTIRPRVRALADVFRAIDSRREALRARQGLLDDSSRLIREDRDSR